MNFRELEYFVAIAEQGHFGKAARAVNVSQPTLSMQFKKLEQSLGGNLIERLPRGAILTPLGEEVFPIAREILRLADDLERRCGAKESHGRLKVGIIPTISPYLLPRMNRGLRKTFATHKISLLEAQTTELVRLVREGSLDVAILSTPLEEDGITEVDIYSEPFYLAVHQEHRLARRKRVNLSDIEDEKLLILEEGHCLRNQALAVCSLPQATSDADLSATSIETLRSMVALGVGVTLMPKLAIRKGEPIVYVPFSDNSFRRKVGVIYRSSLFDTSFIHSLIEIMKTVARRDHLTVL